MSTFSQQTKDELMQIENQNIQEELAVLSALVKINGKLVIKNGETAIIIPTENLKIADFILKTCEKVFKLKGTFAYSQNDKLKKNHNFTVSFDREPLKILKKLGIMDQDGNFLSEPSIQFTQTNDILSHYLRGTFLASGSINNPLSRGGYHLEITVDDLVYANFLATLINKRELNAKVCKRRNKYIVYLKRGESIADFLKLIKATQTMIYYEDYRINMDYENNYNRTVNCFCANENRRRKNAEKQLMIIEYLEKNNLVNSLDQKSQRLINIRKENVEGSLSELSDQYQKLYGEIISRSTIRTVFINLERFVKDDEK